MREPPGNAGSPLIFSHASISNGACQLEHPSVWINNSFEVVIRSGQRNPWVNYHVPGINQQGLLRT